jgi:hypothetical protein
MRRGTWRKERRLLEEDMGVFEYGNQNRGMRTLVYGKSLVMGHCMALGVYPFWSLRKVNAH